MGESPREFEPRRYHDMFFYQQVAITYVHYFLVSAVGPPSI